MKCVHDSELTTIRAWQRGDEQAIRAVFDRYYPQAVHIAELSGMTLESAQDCAQEAFVCAFKKRHQLRNPESFAFWFHRIATRYVLDSPEMRQRNREVSLEASQEVTEYVEAPEQTQPDTVAISGEEREHLWRRVQALPPNYRLPLALHYYGDFSIHEVATLIGKRESTVRVTIHRALRMLRLLSQGEQQEATRKQSQFLTSTNYSLRTGH